MKPPKSATARLSSTGPLPLPLQQQQQQQQQPQQLTSTLHTHMMSQSQRSQMTSSSLLLAHSASEPGMHTQPGQTQKRGIGRELKLIDYNYIYL